MQADLFNWRNNFDYVFLEQNDFREDNNDDEEMSVDEG